MIHKMRVQDIAECAAFFEGPQLEMVTDAIVTGNTDGRFWTVSRDGDIAMALLWDQGNNAFYLSGEGVDDGIVAEMGALIADQVRPAAIESGLSYFKVRTPEHVASALPILFAETGLQEKTGFFYVLAGDAPAPEACDGVHFVPIDRALLQRPDLDVKRVKGEIAWMWPSLNRFYEHGFGWAALAGDQVVCWCTAEYVGRRRCGIGVETLPEFQGRGIATTAVRHFVRHSMARRLTPCWECGADNLASVRVAEKAGFTRVAESPYRVGRFSDKG